MNWTLHYTNRAQKDAQNISAANLKTKTQNLLSLIATNPFKTPPPYEKLVGDLDGCCSRRINIQHRLVYTIHEKEKAIKILRMWTHYE